MGQHPNEALIRRGFEAFNTGDVATLRGLFADDAVQLMGGNNFMTGEHKGRDNILDMYGELAARTGGSFQARLEEVFANDLLGVAIYRGTGEREGKKLDERVALVFEILNGRFVKLTDVPADQAAEDAFLS
jgi:ketosteroid isomerase-like protein